MKFKSTAIMAVIFVAVTAVVYYYDIIDAPERFRQMQLENRFFSYEADDIKQLTFTRSDTVFSFENRDDGEWYFTSPLEVKADQESLNGIINTLLFAEKYSSVSDGLEDIEQYGFNADSVEIRMIDDDDSEYSLHVGSWNVLGTYTYVRTDEVPNIFISSPLLYTITHGQLFNYRDKTIVEFDRNKTNKIIVSEGKIDVILVQQDGQWSIIDPVNEKAEESTVKNIFDYLSGTDKITNFISEDGKNPSEQKLFKDRKSVELFFDDETSLNVAFSKKSNSEFYAKDNRRSTLYTVDTLTADYAVPSLFMLRNKDVSRFDRAIVNSVTIRIGTDVRTYTKERGMWYQVFPIYQKAVSEKIEKMIEAVFYVRAVEFVDNYDSSNIAKYGMDNPETDITFINDKKELTRIKIGRPVGRNRYYFNALNEKMYQVRAYIHPRLVIPPNQLVENKN